MEGAVARLGGVELGLEVRKSVAAAVAAGVAVEGAEVEPVAPLVATVTKPCPVPPPTPLVPAGLAVKASPDRGHLDGEG